MSALDEFIESSKPKTVGPNPTQLERLKALINQERPIEVHPSDRDKDPKWVKDVLELFGDIAANARMFRRDPQDGHERTPNEVRLLVRNLSRLLRRERKRGELTPDPTDGEYPPRIANEQLPSLVALIAEKPDRTIAELCKEWFVRHRTKLSCRHVPHAPTRRPHAKKVLHLDRAGAGRCPRRRRAFLREIAEVDPNDLVFLGESGCNIAMTVSYGRAPRAFESPIRGRRTGAGTARSSVRSRTIGSSAIGCSQGR